MAGFIVAQHNAEGRLILAVCDADVHGRKFEEGEAVLDLGTRFYSGQEKDAAGVEKLMLKAYTIHVVGKAAVAVAIKLGLGAKEDAKTVAGVPHVQILMI